MSFRIALSAHLLDATITTRVATRSDGLACVWPGIRPEGSGDPAVVHTVVADDPVVDLDGEDAAGAGLVVYRVQVDCYAAKYDQVVALAEAVHARMRTAASTFYALPIEGGGADLYEAETKLHRVVREYQCWYTPAG